MKIRELGEFGLIDRIVSGNIVEDDTVLLGIGDDAAILKPPSGGLVSLATTDMLVEGVHFDLRFIEPWQLGWKAAAVNISDIAAMGGIPRHLLVALGINGEMDVEVIDDIYRGMRDICRQFGVSIVGGDTVSSPGPLIINIALLGEVEYERATRRSGTRPGDIIMVTGNLGLSAAGLALLISDREKEIPQPTRDVLKRAHLEPLPRVREGRIAALSGAVAAMDDISDGLASEIWEISKASHVGAILWGDRIPVSPEVRQAAELLGRGELDFALYGGEDYELVFTVLPARVEEIAGRIFNETGTQVTAIGEIVSYDAGLNIISQGEVKPLVKRGYDHFTVHGN